MKKLPTKDSGTQFAPLRSLDDFLLGSARFQVPNFKDMDKWGNRVRNNLLYYQTNYFLTSAILFIIIGVIHPVNIACGMLVCTVMATLFWYFKNNSSSVSLFNKDRPILSVVIICVGLYGVYYMLPSIMVLFIAIKLPVLVTTIHASLRLRNLKNKLANHMENSDLKQTPMGFFLKEVGLQTES